jgi:hypothetical protein
MMIETKKALLCYAAWEDLYLIIQTKDYVNSCGSIAYASTSALCRYGYSG